MKAYEYDDDDGMATIYYAETTGQAKYLVKYDYDIDFTDIRVRRAKWADEYGSMDEIPPIIFIKQGWGWDCLGCNKMLYEDDFEEKRAITEDGEIYCKECWDKLRR